MISPVAGAVQIVHVVHHQVIICDNFLFFLFALATNFENSLQYSKEWLMSPVTVDQLTDENHAQQHAYTPIHTQHNSFFLP